MPIIVFLILIFLSSLGQTGTALAAAAPGDRVENLQYRLSLGPWDDVARVHLLLIRVGPDRYRAEFGGAAQGLWSLLSRWLPEGYETEMALEHGRLKPLIYRETFQAKGHRVRKEYRFDYSQGVLELWRGEDRREPVKKWQIPLKGPVYDPLSLFYNLRLGAWDILAAGQTLRLAMVPTPEPREMVLRLGPETSQGQKVMVELTGVKGKAEGGTYLIFCNPRWVPQKVSTPVAFLGKLSGQLLNPGEIRKDGLTAASLPSTPTLQDAGIPSRKADK